MLSYSDWKRAEERRKLTNVIVVTTWLALVAGFALGMLLHGH